MPAISQLPVATSINIGDLYVIVQGGVTKQATDSLVLSSIQSTIQITESQVTNLTTDLANRLIAALNLADLTNVPNARLNLGLGSIATHSASDYVAVTGSTMTGYLILNADPVLPLGAATREYVDNAVIGLNFQSACYAATTANLSANYNNGTSGIGATLTNNSALSAFSVDGVSPPLNSRILVKNQSSAFQNGIYIVTTVGSGSGSVAWVLTRSLDYDIPAEIMPGDLVAIVNGTLNSLTSWIQISTVTTIGTDAINFSQFSASIPYSVSVGGTGRTNSTTAYGLIAAGTTATGALQTLSTGSNGQILQSAGAAALPTYSTATYPSVATGTGTVLRANGTNWLASTSAFADTYSASTILYSNGANNVTGLATNNNSVLVTSVSGVPSLSTSLPNGINIGTPSAGVLTNCTGLPISTGVSGLGTGIATFLATPSSANLAAAVTDETGTGALVFSTSPSLVTPLLGTPTSGTLTNCTGLPITTGVSGLAAGIATFLTTPSSANLAAAITDETGTGSLVFATSPSLVTPLLGTPTSGTLTNCTGLPLTTGVTGILPLASGGTNKALTASNGGIVWSDAASMEILAGTATARQMLQSGSTATPAWSTSTYPATNAINTLLYASAANVMSALSTAIDGVLVTSNTGVPSILAGPGTSGRTLLSQAASAPIWSTGLAITQISSIVFTTSGTYTPTTGMVSCKVELVGGGGGGGGAATSGGGNAAVGGAGGAGGYSRKLFTAATIGASQTVTIGAAGTAGTAGNNAGGNGGTTNFGTLPLLSATGGNGGAGGPAATAGAYLGGTGGAGSSGDFNTTGNAGAPGFTNNTIVMGGNGGSSFFGGAALGRVSAGAGNNANSYGGGGSGGATSNSTQQAGGAGQPGIIVITEYINI